MAIELYRATTGQTFARRDLVTNTFEKLRARMGIRIDKYKPIACSCSGAAVPRPRDLIDRLENHLGSGASRDFGSFVSRIVVAKDYFSFPAAFMKRSKRRVDVAQSFAKTPLFVKRWDDRRDFQLLPISCRVCRKAHREANRRTEDEILWALDVQISAHR
jgi:hypothetical protein